MKIPGIRVAGIVGSALRYRGARAEFGPATLGNIQSHLAQLPNQTSRPAIDVMFTHQLSHSLHTHLLLFGLHFERRPNRLRSLIDVVRMI